MLGQGAGIPFTAWCCQRGKQGQFLSSQQYMATSCPPGIRTWTPQGAVWLSLQVPGEPGVGRQLTRGLRLILRSKTRLVRGPTFQINVKTQCKQTAESTSSPVPAVVQQSGWNTSRDFRERPTCDSAVLLRCCPHQQPSSQLHAQGSKIWKQYAPGKGGSCCLSFLRLAEPTWFAPAGTLPWARSADPEPRPWPGLGAWVWPSLAAIAPAFFRWGRNHQALQDCTALASQ